VFAGFAFAVCELPAPPQTLCSSTMDGDANDALHPMDTWRQAAIVPANASSVRSMAQRRLEAPTVTDDEDEDEEDDDAAADDDGGVADADNTNNHRLGPSRARQARSRVPSPVVSQAGLRVAGESVAARSGSGVPKSGAGTKRPRSRPPAGTCGSEPGELSFVPMPFASARTRATSSRRTRSSSPMDGEEEAAAEEASADEEDAPVANLPRPTWCRVPTGLQEAEVAPKMLAGHSVVAHSGFLFFFGGFDGEFGLGQVNEVSHSNAVYQYHPDTDDWCTLSPNRLHDPEQESPAARRHASLVFEGGSFYLYGKWGGELFFVVVTGTVATPVSRRVTNPLTSCDGPHPPPLVFSQEASMAAAKRSGICGNSSLRLGSGVK
jgi:Kelch motif